MHRPGGLLRSGCAECALRTARTRCLPFPSDSLSEVSSVDLSILSRLAKLEDRHAVPLELRRKCGGVAT